MPTPSMPSIPTPLPAAAPATMANADIAMTAANQRKKAAAAAGGAGNTNPDLAAAPSVAKSNILGP